MFSSGIYSVAVAVTDTALLPAADSRESVTFNSPPSGTITYSPEGTAVLGRGITLAAGEPSVTLTYATHGTIVRRAWRAIHSVGGVTVLVFDALGKLSK